MNATENMDSSMIQAELNRLGESTPTGKKIKAALFNLIVYTHETIRAQYFKKIVKTISDQFPCRLIFIQADIVSQHSSIKVQVSLPNSGNSSEVSSEQIFIEASGTEIERIPFLILPQLIPDLPIYLLWGQDPNKETIILPHIQPLARRIIFDSESTNELGEFSKEILNLVENSSLEIVDMNWIRIAGWRQIITRAFDTKTRIDLISKTSYMKLTYNSLEDPSFTKPETRAIYLQAWIASCLEWNFEKIEINEQKTIILHYTGPHAIQIHLVSEIRKDLAAEEIIEWELCDPNNYDCVFSHRTMTQVEVKASNQYQCLLPFSFLLPGLNSGRTLMQEIFYQKISDQYAALLKLIIRIETSVSSK